MAQVVRGGEAGGALESVLVELEPLVVVSGMVASSRMGRDWCLVLTILMGAASFTIDCCMHDSTITLTRRVCHRRGRSGGVGCAAWGRRCVLMGSSGPSVGDFELLWGGLVYEWPSQTSALCDKVSRG